MSIRIGNKIVASTTNLATTQKAGSVKPDGTTIKIDSNGVISSDVKSIVIRDWSV